MKLSSLNFGGQPHSLKRLFFYVLIFLGINAFIFLILDHIGFIHYAMIDDFFIQNLLNGSMGEYYTFFQQTNVVLNTALASLYKSIPAINWYSVCLFTSLILSASFAGAVFADKFTLKAGIPIYLATVPVYYGVILLNFTYTTVCYGVLAGAFICLIDAFFTENRLLRRILYIIGGFLLCLSLLIRYEAVYSALVYAGLIVLWLLIRYKKKSLYTVLAFAVSFGAAGCFFAGEQAYYSSDPELNYYIRFNNARTNLEDKAPLTYDLYQTLFQDMEWTPTDADMINNFYIPDDDRFSAERMEYIYENMKPTRYNKDTNAIVSGVLSTFSDYYVYGNICLFVFLVLVWLTNKNRWTRIFACLIAVLPYLFYILFTILWRVVFRTAYPHFIISILILLTLINQNKFDGIADGLKNLPEKTLKPTAAVIAVICAFAAAGLANTFVRAKYSNEERVLQLGTDPDFIKNIFENMSLNSDYAFIYTAPSSPLLSANLSYGIFDTIEKDKLKNSRLLGGWISHSPAYNDFKEQYSIVSLPNDLLDNDNLLLVVPDETYTKQYFIQKYGIEIELEEVVDLGYGIGAYSVKS